MNGPASRRNTTVGEDLNYCRTEGIEEEYRLIGREEGWPRRE